MDFPGVAKLSDLCINGEDMEGGAYVLLSCIRPKWNRELIEFFVSDLLLHRVLCHRCHKIMCVLKPKYYSCYLNFVRDKTNFRVE